MKTNELNTKVLSFITKYTNKNDQPPSLDKIKDGLKIRLSSSLNSSLKQLEKDQLIRRNFITNEIELVNFDDSKVNNIDLVQVPLLGKIAAGLPIEAIVDEDNYITLPSNMLKTREIFALKVSGDSMIDSYLIDKDIVICEKSQTARNGEIVVALFLDNTATLKKFYKEKDHIRLQPMNEKYPPILTKKLTIQGKVVSVVRQLQ